MNAVAMESANRAYVQQTLNRLKDIATGQAPELPEKETKEPASKKSTRASSPKKRKTAGKAVSAKKRPGSTEISPNAKEFADGSIKSTADLSSPKEKSSPAKKKSVPNK
jgi:hypothetical protein